MVNKKVLRPAAGTALILLIPLVMTILDRGKAAGEGWHWSPMDFVVMGALLFGAGFAYEIVAGRLRGRMPKIALGAVILLAVIAIWIELAVDGVSQLLAWLIA